MTKLETIRARIAQLPPNEREPVFKLMQEVRETLFKHDPWTAVVAISVLVFEAAERAEADNARDGQ